MSYIYIYSYLLYSIIVNYIRMYLGKVHQLYHKIAHTKLIIDISNKHYYIINHRNIIIKSIIHFNLNINLLKFTYFFEIIIY